MNTSMKQLQSATKNLNAILSTKLPLVGMTKASLLQNFIFAMNDIRQGDGFESHEQLSPETLQLYQELVAETGESLVKEGKVEGAEKIECEAYGIAYDGTEEECQKCMDAEVCKAKMEGKTKRKRDVKKVKIEKFKPVPSWKFIFQQVAESDGITADEVCERLHQAIEQNLVRATVNVNNRVAKMLALLAKDGKIGYTWNEVGIKLYRLAE